MRSFDTFGIHALFQKKSYSVTWGIRGDKPSTILQTTQFIGAFLNRSYRAKKNESNPRVFFVKHEVRPSVSQFHETVSNGRKITDIPIDTKIFLGNHPGLGEDLWLPKACKFGHCKHATAPRVNLKSNGNVMYPNVQMFTLQNENASIFVLYLWTRKNMVVYIVGDPPRINRRFRGLTMENIVTFFPLNLSITNSKFIDNI